MPQIIVTAGDAADVTEGTVVLRERINVSDFESERFAANLVERLGWAVTDAADVERSDSAWEDDGAAVEDDGGDGVDARDLVEA
jgi:hypothetical protein